MFCVAAAFTHGAIMKKEVAVCSSEFEKQARETVSLALALCEDRIKAGDGNITAELKVLASATLSLEAVIAVLMAAERLCR